jgi:hypothetical protein
VGHNDDHLEDYGASSFWTLKIGPDCDSLVGSLVVFMQLWTSGMEKDWGSYFGTF